MLAPRYQELQPSAVSIVPAQRDNASTCHELVRSYVHRILLAPGERGQGHRRILGPSGPSAARLTVSIQPASACSVGSMTRLPALAIAARQSAIHSTCCSIETSMFDKTEGEPGPVTVKRLGKPATCGGRTHHHHHHHHHHAPLLSCPAGTSITGCTHAARWTGDAVFKQGSAGPVNKGPWQWLHLEPEVRARPGRPLRAQPNPSAAGDVDPVHTQCNRPGLIQ